MVGKDRREDKIAGELNIMKVNFLRRSVPAPIREIKVLCVTFRPDLTLSTNRLGDILGFS